MATVENKVVVQRVHEEGWNKRDVDAIVAACGPDFVDHTAPHGVSPDVDGASQFATMYLTAFPDLHLSIEAMIAEGDLVVTRWRSSGTHQGALMGIPPTGKQTSSAGITINRVTDGKIVESWLYWEQLGLLQQLGAIPTPEQAPI